ncbi:MAG: hypothetical protein BGO01_08295 [Armatimonadetes bacterium 55-13]|mgnify:CR=1 FL=1|nr:MAG: hypothetical protein BGO01_08295 [Armatimonadetes bacterium 55-13]
MNPINRRTFLRGVGTAMALPLLDAMLPLNALAQSAAKAVKPMRMAFMFVPNGISMEHWTPASEGAGYALPSVLDPIKDLKDDFSILTGLSQDNAFALGDGPGDHARSTACWLTGVHPKKTSGADIKSGISVDQVAAKAVGGLTPFASLEIGCERGAMAGDCDSGYSCAYSSNIAWRSESTPVAKEVNPRLVFERLFGSGDKAGQEQSRARRDLFTQSILDIVMEDATRLKSRLGKRDQGKLDEYFESVRDIEKRIIKLEQVGRDMALAQASRPTGIPHDYGEHIRLMGDMMVLAFQADLTRICTFMFANDGSNRSYPMIGVPEGHHDMSHHGKDPAKLEKKRLIDQYHIDQLGYVLRKLKSIKETDGTMLDNTMVVYGAGISDGDRHNHDNLPILFAGKAGGAFKTGRHVVYKNHTPLNNLYLSMLDRMGVRIESLGNSTGKLAQLW